MDTQIVVRAQQGDRDAFAMLVEAVGDRLHSIAQGVLRDLGLSEDATQQALLQIWRDLPKLRDPTRFDAWAYRILVRAAYSEARRARRWPPGMIVTAEAEPIVADGSSVIVDRDQIERAFQRLSLEQRTIVVLRHFMDLPLEQIAETLEIPLHTARSRLYHAMRALRAAMDADARNASSAPIGREVAP